LITCDPVAFTRFARGCAGDFGPACAKAAFLVAPDGFALAEQSASDNRYMDLAPVVGATARSVGLVSIQQSQNPTDEQLRISAEITPSRWVLVARGMTDLGALARNHRWSSLDDVDGPVWTDDYSNVISVLRY